MTNRPTLTDLAPSVSQKFDQLTEQLADKAKQINYVNRNIESPPQKGKMVAHRGSSYAPENTLISIELASKEGYYGVETDVRITSDGVPVIMHDATVDRTTNGTGNVTSLTLSQIKFLTIDAGPNISKYSGLTIPTLEEFLLEAKKHKMFVVLDCNNVAGHETEFINIIQRCGMETSVILHCAPSVYNAVKEINPIIQAIYYGTTPLTKSLIDEAKSYNADGVSYNDYTPDYSNDFLELVRYAHSIGLKLDAYYVNTQVRSDWLKENNIDYIVADVAIDTEQQEIEITKEIIIANKNQYQYYMNPVLNNEQSNIPAENVNGFYFDETNGVMHVNTTNGYSGYIIEKDLGRFKKGDVVEVIAKINVESGSLRTTYLDQNNTVVDDLYFGAGEQIIHRKFVIHADTNKLTLLFGYGSTSVGRFRILDGIIIRIKSTRNEIPTSTVGITYPTKLRGKFRSDNGATEHRFNKLFGDDCVISSATANNVLITFSNALETTAVALISLDGDSSPYVAHTYGATTNGVQVYFVNASTGEIVSLASLPQNLTFNLALL